MAAGSLHPTAPIELCKDERRVMKVPKKEAE